MSNLLKNVLPEVLGIYLLRLLHPDFLPHGNPMWVIASPVISTMATLWNQLIKERRKSDWSKVTEKQDSIKGLPNPSPTHEETFSTKWPGVFGALFAQFLRHIYFENKELCQLILHLTRHAEVLHDNNSGGRKLLRPFFSVSLRGRPSIK